MCGGGGGNREEERRAAFSCVYSVLSVGLSGIFSVITVAHLHDLLVHLPYQVLVLHAVLCFSEILAGAWLCLVAPHVEEDKTHSSS